MTPTTKQKPNIKFYGAAVWDRGKKKRLDQVRPIEQFSDRGRIVNLPPADEQLKNRLFFHPAAAAIARMFPKHYKLVR